VQPAALEADSLQPTATEQTGEPLEPLLELFSAPGQVAIDVALDGQAGGVRRDVGLGQQVSVEAPPSARAVDPNIAGTQPVP
jgi:hypothetical protein